MFVLLWIPDKGKNEIIGNVYHPDSNAITQRCLAIDKCVILMVCDMTNVWVKWKFCNKHKYININMFSFLIFIYNKRKNNIVEKLGKLGKLFI